MAEYELKKQLRASMQERSSDLHWNPQALWKGVLETGGGSRIIPSAKRRKEGRRGWGRRRCDIYDVMLRYMVTNNS